MVMCPTLNNVILNSPSYWKEEKRRKCKSLVKKGGRTYKKIPRTTEVRMEYGHLHTSSKRSSQVMEWEEQEELKRARRSSGEGNAEKNEVKAGLLCQSRREK